MVSNPFSENLFVEVGGDTSDATGALASLQSSLVGTKAKALALGGVLGGALAVAGLAKATQAAADFEEAMVEVEKVTSAETAAAMTDEIQRMSRTIPLAQEELAGLAADAGRFGVQGEENIAAFTESVAKMAEATNLSANEAGESLSRLAELTDTPVKQIENLGSAVNALSNNMATSSSEIVDSMLRSSAALSQFGLNQKQIAGISGALNEVSESSQRAGTRLRRLAQEMMSPKKQGDIAAALGMTSDELAQMQQDAPVEIMRMMAKRFAEGGKQADALRSALGTASRQAVAGLAQNLDGMNRGLERSATQFQKNTSLQREFEAATDTFNAQMQLAKNRLREYAITIGNRVLPTATKLLKQFNNSAVSADRVGKAFDFVLRTASSAASTIKTNLISAFQTLKPIIQPVVNFVENLANKFGLLDTDVGNTADEVGKIIGMAITPFFVSWVNLIDRVVTKHRDKLEPALNTAESAITGVIDTFKNINPQPIIAKLKTISSNFDTESGNWKQSITSVNWQQLGTNLTEDIAAGINTTIPKVQSAADSVTSKIQNEIDRVPWGQSGETIGGDISTGIEGTTSAFATATTTVTDIVENGIDNINWFGSGQDIGEGIVDGLASMNQAVKAWKNEQRDAILTIVTETDWIKVGADLLTAFAEGMRTLGKGAKAAKNLVKGIMVGIAGGMLDGILGEDRTKWIATGKEIISDIESAINETKSNLTNLVDDIVNDMEDSINDFSLNPLEDEIDNAIEAFRDAKETIVGNSIVPDMVDAVTSEFDRMAMSTAQKTALMTDQLVANFQQTLQAWRSGAIEAATMLERLDTLRESVVGGGAGTGGTISTQQFIQGALRKFRRGDISAEQLLAAKQRIRGQATGNVGRESVQIEFSGDGELTQMLADEANRQVGRELRSHGAR